MRVLRDKHYLLAFLCLSLAPSLTFAQRIDFTFDTNRPVHAPASDNHFTYTYDAAGNLKTETETGSGSTTVYFYNAYNKMKRVEKNGIPVSGFLYDMNGVRIAKTDGNGTITERYFGEIEKKESSSTRYYFVGSQRIAKRDEGNVLAFIHQDHLGSASVVTDETGGPILDRKFYEFGAVQSQTGSNDEAHSYNDKRLDEEIDQFDYEARSYAAKSFRFTTPDSIVPNPADPQSFNRYAYVRNNPLKYIDPTGHEGEEVDIIGWNIDTPPPMPKEIASAKQLANVLDIPAADAQALIDHVLSFPDAREVNATKLNAIAGGKINPSDAKYYAAHELQEARKMKAGLSYKDAHSHTVLEMAKDKAVVHINANGQMTSANDPKLIGFGKEAVEEAGGQFSPTRAREYAHTGSSFRRAGTLWKSFHQSIQMQMPGLSTLRGLRGAATIAGITGAGLAVLGIYFSYRDLISAGEAYGIAGPKGVILQLWVDKAGALANSLEENGRILNEENRSQHYQIRTRPGLY